MHARERWIVAAITAALFAALTFKIGSGRAAYRRSS